MKIYNLDTENLFSEADLCLAIGNFDGFHKGHQEIIKMLKQISIKKNLPSAIMSFDPHPRSFFNKTVSNFNIYTKEDKIKFLNDFQLDIYINFSFDKKLSEYSSTNFVKKILVNKLKINNLVVGSDFKFGKNRSGNIELLNQLSIEHSYRVNLVDTIKIKNSSEKYSSSLIRKDIQNGNMESVHQSLGRYWHITGKIIQGQRKAREINFPTANIELSDHILPKKGVYCVEVTHENKTFFGISNFGYRPTVKGDKLLLETHIFNFNKEIYGNELTVRFLTFIRSEQKFKNFDLLTIQIKKDIEVAKKYHNI